MTAYILVSTYLVLIALAATTARAADPPKGSVIAAEIVSTWRCQDQLKGLAFAGAVVFRLFRTLHG